MHLIYLSPAMLSDAIIETLETNENYYFLLIDDHSSALNFFSFVQSKLINYFQFQSFALDLFLQTMSNPTMQSVPMAKLKKPKQC